MQDSDRLGPNIRSLRLQRGLSLDQLAKESDLTRGYLSMVERNLKSPSITASLRVAAVLGVNIGELFGTVGASPGQYTLLRHRDQNSREKDKFELFALAPGRPGKLMEPFLIQPPTAVAAKSSPKGSHAGEEMIVVISGKVKVRLGEEMIVLEPRDCLYFSGEEQHEIQSLGEERAEVLVVVAVERSERITSAER